MQDYIELWKYFSGRVDTLSDRLWTVGTWLLALAGTVIALIWQVVLKAWESAPVAGMEPFASLLLAVVGVVICYYAHLAIRDHSYHIERNQKRQEKVTSLLPPLKAEIIGRPSSGRRKVKAERHLQNAVRGFGGLFVLTAVLSLVRLVMTYLV